MKGSDCQSAGTAPLGLRTTRGVAWSTLTMLLARLVQTVTTLVLARLLLPADFGLIAVALIVINALSLFRDMGLNQALIHRRDSLGLAADTAFYMMPALGLLLATITFVSAPVAASLFGNPDATNIIRVLSACLFISSFGLVPATMLERELHFRRKALPDSLPVIGYCAAALIAAAYGMGVWSLVIGEIIRSLLIATVVWPFSPWRPRLRFSLPVARQLLAYGRHIVGAGIAIFLFTNADNAAISRWLGAEQLGLYVLAFTLGAMTLTQIAYSINRVLFPSFSSLQHDRQALAGSFSKTNACVSALFAPVTLVITILGPLFLRLLYGDKWEGSVTALQILAFYGFFRAAGGGAGEVLKSLGKPRLLALVTYAQLLLVLVLLYPAVRYGEIAGVAMLFTGATFIGALLATYLACRACGAPVIKIYGQILTPLLFAVVASLAARAGASLLFPEISWSGLMVSAVLLLIFYAGLLLVFSRATVSYSLSLLRRKS